MISICYRSRRPRVRQAARHNDFRAQLKASKFKLESGLAPFAPMTRPSPLLAPANRTLAIRVAKAVLRDMETGQPLEPAVSKIGAAIRHQAPAVMSRGQPQFVRGQPGHEGNKLMKSGKAAPRVACEDAPSSGEA